MLKKKLFYLLMVSVCVLLLSGCGNKVANYEDLLVSDVVVLNNNGYRMYNENGKQINKEVYNYISSFKNGLAVAKDKNNKYGVINTKGKMIVPFGKYEYIAHEDFLFVARDKNLNKFLLNSKGKVASDLKDKEIVSFILDHGVVILDTEKEYQVFDRDGKQLTKIKKNKTSDDIKMSELEGNYLVIRYNDVSYVVNVIKKKVVVKLDGNYSVSSMNTIDTERYVLYDKSTSQDKPFFRLMKNGRTIFTDDTCTNLFYEYHNNNLLCSKSYNGRYVVNDKKELLVETYKSDVKYIDGKNYINKVDLKNTEIYVGGKLKEKVECYRPYSVSRSSKIYNLEGRCSETENKVAFYSISGKLLHTLDNVKSASSFDENNLSIVRNTKDQYYLINQKYKVVSNTYDRVYEASHNSGFYTAKKGDKYYLINKSGKEIDYSDNSISGGDNYYKLVQGKKNIYYTYKGMKIKTN
ncbi:MAG: hypothetical protein E7160_04975 [Firmicutes bacterium]|nr:hypothetical protein [Bacillota bacterium]